MPSFDDFKNEWLGHRVDYDHILNYQCVDLIRQYFLECFGLAGGGGVPTAVAYWTSTPGDVLAKFTRDGSGNVQKGDVVILRTLGHTDYSGDGHIGIATGNGDPNSIEILEQNGAGSGTGLGQDAIRTRYVPRNRLAGVLRPIPIIPAPIPYALTVQPMTPEHSASRYQVRLGAEKWNLDLPNFDAINNHPVGTASSDPSNPTYIWVTDYLIRTDLPQYIYYLEDGNLHQGWNRNDLTAAPLPVVMAAPTVIKTPNVVVPKAEKYTVLTKLMAFSTALDAMNKANYSGTDVQPGEYFVWSRDANAINLTTDNVQNQSLWINSNDNVLQPPIISETVTVSTPIVPTLPVDPVPAHDEPVDPPTPAPTVEWRWYNQDQQPSTFKYTGTLPAPVHDLQHPEKTLTLPVGASGPISRYAMINGNTYLIPDSEFKKGSLFGIPENLMQEQRSTPVQAVNSVVHEDARTWDEWLETGFKSASRLIREVVPAVESIVKTEKVAQARVRIDRSIEGITKKVK
jgi:hypothetical protein